MTWDDVSVAEFIEILELQYDNLTPTERQLESIAIITGETYDDLEEDELMELIKEYAWLYEMPVSNEQLPRYNLLKMGELISLEKFVTEKPPLQNTPRICAVLYGYDDFQTKCDFIYDDYAPKYICAVDGYLKYRETLFKNYEDLFIPNDDEDATEEEDVKQEAVEQRWAWMRIVWDLADGDITKVNSILELPHLMVFNWITMVKDLKLNQPKQIVPGTEL